MCAVVLNVDDSCPNDLKNQQYVEYLFQAQPKGLVTLDFKQNGDYYISCAVRGGPAALHAGRCGRAAGRAGCLLGCLPRRPASFSCC